MITRLFGTAAAAAVLALALVACAPTADPGTDTGSDGSSQETTDETTEEGTDTGFVALPGTGEYESGDTIPIGGYELVGVDSQPDGCTWTLYVANGEVFVENTGGIVFITDVTGKFVTNGCPDWEQFE